MNLQINTEAEIDACVKSIGGIKVSDLFQGSPSFNNADYLIKDCNVVAELKCLSEDKATDKALQEKTKLIIRRHLAESKIIVFGTRPMTSDQLSADCTKEITELYRKPIKSAMKKANKQIRETKSNLNIESAHGLLILVNDNNTAIVPGRIDWIMSETFKRDRFSSIDSVLFLTLNLIATHPEIKNDLLVWIEGSRDPDIRCPQILYETLRTALHKRWTEILRKDITWIEFRNHDDINEMKYKAANNSQILIKIDQ